MSNFKEEINEDLLNDIYLAKKRVDSDKPFFKTLTDKYYLLDSDVVLCSPVDENDLSFSIFDMNYKQSGYEPLLEIHVDPTTTEITFVSTKDSKSDIRIKATFDNVDNNWDVRSYVSGDNTLSTLNDSIMKLCTIPYYGMEEYDGFIRLIYATQNLGKKNKIRNL